MDIGDIQSRRYDLPTLVLKKYPYRTYAALATSVSECLVDVALYRKSDGLDHSKRQATNWRRDALIDYNANGVYHGEGSKDAWCHVSGKWFHEEDIKAAHIQLVTLCLSSLISEALVGFSLAKERHQLDEQAMHFSCRDELSICSTRYTYHLVIVPVDVTENPITPYTMANRYYIFVYHERKVHWW